MQNVIGRIVQAGKPPVSQKGSTFSGNHWGRNTLLKSLLAAAVTGLVFCTFAEESRSLFHQPEADAERVAISQAEGGGLWFKTEKGRLLAGVSVEGRNADKTALAAAALNSPDFVDPDALCLQFDASQCLKENEDKVVVRLYGISEADAALCAGKPLHCELWAKASVDGAPCRLFLEGNDGKHYYKAVPLVANRKWTRLSLDIPLAPETLTKLWIRLDLSGRTIYTISSPSVFAGTNEEETSAAAADNLILNGGAENGWNAICVLDPASMANSRGELLNFAKDGFIQPPYSEWVLDDEVSYSGRYSFKGIHRSTTGAQSSLYFNPVPFEVGKPACFSIAMKADRKCRGGLGLFIANALAYGKSVALDTEWRRFSLFIPAWGSPVEGISKSGDVSTGYGCPLRLAYPRIDIPEGCDFIWLDDAAYAMAASAEPTHNDVSIRGGLDRGTTAYQPGETVRAVYEIENASSVPLELQLVFEGYNYFGELVSSVPAGSIRLSGGEIAGKNYDFKPTLLGPQNLILKVSCEKSGRIFSHSSYFGVFRRAEKLHPWFGENADPKPNAKTLSRYLKDFGIGSVRLWESYNHDLDRPLGFDDVSIYKGEGFYTLMCTGYGPTGEGALVPVDLAPYETYLAHLATEHKGEIDCYEILNEVNIWGARTPNPDPSKFTYMSVDRYVDTLAAAFKALKSADPSIRIGGPTTCHTDVAWTAGVLEKGGAKYLDIITEHPYRARPEMPDYERDIVSMKTVIEKYGGGLPVYADECGEIMPQAPDEITVSNKVRDSVARSVRMQLIAYANGVEKYFHFSANLQNVGSCWSILYLGNPAFPGDVRPNPYLYAVRSMQEHVDGAKPMGRIDVGSAFRCYALERDGKRILAFWKCQEEDRPSTVSFRLPVKDFRIFDIMGNPVAVEGDSFPVSPSPCYIETSMKLAELKALFTSASISGVGLPFSLGVSILGENSFAVNVENRINNPISGRLELTDETGVVEGAKTMEFKAVPPDAVSSLVFTTSSPIGIEPKPVKVRAVLEDASAFDVREFVLQAMLCPKAQPPVTLDGDLSDWPDSAKPVELKAVKATEALWKPEDEAIRGRTRVCWRDDGLYIAVEVDKRDFFPDATVKGPAELYKGDSLQVDFDPLKDGKVARGNETLFDDDDFEYDVGIFNGANTVYRRRASSARYDGLGKEIGLLKGEVEMAVRHVPGKTVYELKFPQSAISPFRLASGSSLRWDVIANLNNGEGRIGWLELTRGIGQCKSPGDFMEIILTEK